MLSRLLIKFAPHVLGVAVALAGATFIGFKGWWHAHKDNKQLAGENSLLRSSIQSADDTLSKHRQADIDLVADDTARASALAALPDDGCLDADLPDGYIRLRR